MLRSKDSKAGSSKFVYNPVTKQEIQVIQLLTQKQEEVVSEVESLILRTMLFDRTNLAQGTEKSNQFSFSFSWAFPDSIKNSACKVKVGQRSFGANMLISYGKFKCKQEQSAEKIVMSLRKNSYCLDTMWAKSCWENSAFTLLDFYCVSPMWAKCIYIHYVRR